MQWRIVAGQGGTIGLSSVAVGSTFSFILPPAPVAAMGSSPALATRNPDSGDMNEFILKLYISGRSPRAERALANLRRICSCELEDRYTVEVIDVLEDPGEAEKSRIMATPTLVKSLPPPVRRVIGDLSDAEKVLLALDIVPRRDRPDKEA